MTQQVNHFVLITGLVVAGLSGLGCSFGSSKSGLTGARERIAFKEAGCLGVCSYSQFKPVSHADGEGYEADLLRAVAKSWGVGIKFYPEPIYEGLWRLPSRDYTLCDVSAGGMTETKERVQETAMFSVGSTAFDQSLLVRRKDYESGKITSYASFENPDLRIGVVPGTTGAKYAFLRAHEARLPRAVFTEMKDETELLAALKLGKIDAIARGEHGNEYQASLDESLVTIAKRGFDETFRYSVDVSNKALGLELNRAIMRITQDGKIGYKDWLNSPDVFMNQVG